MPSDTDGNTDVGRQYRDNLQKIEGEMQSEYDKAVMTLSGGAIGISFAFIKDV